MAEQRLEPRADIGRRPATGAAPLVGISMRLHARPGASDRQFQNDAYLFAVERAGGIPVLLPNLAEPERLRPLFDMCDALILPGGPDIEPSRYGAELRDDCSVSLEPALDRTEVALLAWALESGLPVLAICRGLQLLNVALGGTLWQDVRVEGATVLDHQLTNRHALAHQLKIDPESRLAALAGDGPLDVNTMHHQAIRELSPHLRAVGWSEDGLVEAVEPSGGMDGGGAHGDALLSPEGCFLLGVQCHPEELEQEQSWAARLFEGLVAAARLHRAHGPHRASGPHEAAGT